MPTGGTANQVLAKIDGTNYNTQWVTPASGSADNLGNHTATQALNMNSNNITNVNTITAAKANLQELVSPIFNSITTNNTTLTSANIDATGYTYIKINGSTSASTINGLAGGTQGKIVYLIGDASLLSLSLGSTSETCSSCKIYGTYSGVLTYNSSKWVATLLWESTSNFGAGGWQVIGFLQ